MYLMTSVKKDINRGDFLPFLLAKVYFCNYILYNIDVDGNYKKEMIHMSKRIELEGKYFGKLYVVEYVGKGKYLCRCECGNEKIISGGHLRGGATKSCGCLARELTRKRWAEDDAFRQRQSEAASKASKQMWEDDNFRETMSEKFKDKWDDERRQKQSELMKIRREKWGKNQNYIDMQSRKMKNKWEDEDYRERQSELSRKRMEEMWEREDFRQMHHEMRGNKQYKISTSEGWKEFVKDYPNERLTV